MQYGVRIRILQCALGEFTSQVKVKAQSTDLPTGMTLKLHDYDRIEPLEVPTASFHLILIIRIYTRGTTESTIILISLLSWRSSVFCKVPTLQKTRLLVILYRAMIPSFRTHSDI